MSPLPSLILLQLPLLLILSPLSRCLLVRYLFTGSCRRLLDGQEEFKLGRQLVLAVQPVREVHPPDATVGMDLDAQCLHVIRPVGTSCKVGQVKLDLVPSLVQSHRHGADKGLDPGRRLIVTRPEASSHVLVVKHLENRYCSLSIKQLFLTELT